MDGRRIGGRYRLLERRAIGGMASVWRGRDERTGREVAVKLLHPHLAADADARRRLRREARATETLDHPNVIGVRDVVADRDAPAVVMDYVDGRSLAERLVADGRLPEDEALDIARDVAAALTAAHRRGIVHRDVKPGNILLAPDGRARLGDFGIAADLRADLTGLTGDQGVIGTLRYMAPERLLGENATPATDVWGLGAVLYEMLAGRPAFDTAGGIVGAQRSLPERPGGIGDASWSVIERALATDPAVRYVDGAAFAAALDTLAASPAISADAETAVVPLPAATVGTPLVPPGPARRPRGGRRDHGARPALFVAALGLGALLLGGAIIGLGGAGTSTGAAASADPSGRPAVAATPDVEPTEAPVERAGAEDTDAGQPDGQGRGGDKGKGDAKGKGKEDKGPGHDKPDRD